MSEEAKAKELADKMSFDHFSRKLQDEVFAYDQLMNSKGKDLSKNELRRLLEFAIRLPDIDGIHITPNMAPFCELINNAKCSYLAMNVQFLAEQGQKQAQPQFKGEE